MRRRRSGPGSPLKTCLSVHGDSSGGWDSDRSSDDKPVDEHCRHDPEDPGQHAPGGRAEALDQGGGGHAVGDHPDRARDHASRADGRPGRAAGENGDSKARERDGRRRGEETRERLRLQRIPKGRERNHEGAAGKRFQTNRNQLHSLTKRNRPGLGITYSMVCKTAIERAEVVIRPSTSLGPSSGCLLRVSRTSFQVAAYSSGMVHRTPPVCALKSRMNESSVIGRPRSSWPWMAFPFKKTPSERA